MALAKPHTSLSDTHLLQVIAGALIQITGRNVRYPSDSDTKLLQVWAGALVIEDTLEFTNPPIGGGEPPEGGGGVVVGGGSSSWLERHLFGWFRAMKMRLIMLMDY